MNTRIAGSNRRKGICAAPLESQDKEKREACNMKGRKGKFITFEGIDGSGKSVAVAAVMAFLKSKGIAAIVSREPGGTRLGDAIRRVLLFESAGITPLAEILLFTASFQQSLSEKVLPALKAGKWVLSDRWTDSTIAYQCGGRGVNPGRTRQILEAGCPLKPDLTLYYDVTPKTAAKRLRNRGKPDRIEKAGLAFQKKVWEEYQRIWWDSPNVEVVSTEDLDKEESAARSIEIIRKRFGI